MENSNAGTYKKNLLYIFVACGLLASVLPVLLKRYLATTHAASHISGMLSTALGQTIVIEKITFPGGALQLKGLSLANPADFPRSNLLSIDSVVLQPQWVGLLSGKKTFESIAVEGLTVTLQRNKAGAWNFSQLRHRFSSSKPSSAELFIRHLAIAKGTLQIDGRTFAGLTLNVSNLATKGSERSGVSLEFDDPGRNHYALHGKARLSKDPELEMSLSAPALSLKRLSEMMKSKSAYLPERGTAKLQMSAVLRNGKIRSSGEMSFRSAGMPAVGKGGAFSGTLSCSGVYDMHNDRLAIGNLTLHLNTMPAVHASGSVRDLKQARNFAIDVGTEEIDVNTIAPLIPELEHRKIVIGGKLGKCFMHLSGNAVNGIVSARGNLEFSHGVLIQDKRPVFDDLHATVAITSTGDVLMVAGRAAQAPSAGGAILDTLDAPFKVTLTRHLKIIMAHSPALSARSRGVSFAGRVSYTDGTGLIENATVRAKDVSAEIGRISARVPQKHVSSATVRYPVQTEFHGCDIRRGDAYLKNVSGRLLGAYASNPKARWLEGTADISAEMVAWQGNKSGVSRIHGEFSASEGKADFTAALLDGSIQGSAVFNPFAVRDNVAFKINAKGIQLAGVSRYARLQGDAAVSGGTLEAASTGDYSSSKGLSGHIKAQGNNIAVTGKAGKTMLSAVRVAFDGDVSGQRLVINEALLAVGKDVAARASGALENAFHQDRQGRIAFTMPRTSLAAVTDSFLNVVPRMVQEATVEGDLAVEGDVNLQQGTILLDGAVTLAGAGIDAPTEHIKVSGINGVLPFSLDLAGRAAPQLPGSANFNRQNYAALVKQLRQNVGKSDTITIGAGSFGGVRVNSATIRLRADRGVTEIISLDSSLFGGSLLGKGYITTQNGILYRGDILFNDLSLVQICNAFPAIAGYISGKIDGIVGIQGKGRLLSGITGFAEFWARETAGEKMLVSKEFLQRLAGKKLRGFFFSSDRSYDHAGITAALEHGFLTFDRLDISHTNLFGVRDLSVSIAPSQNRIAIDHLFNAIKEAAVRGKGAAGKGALPEAPPATEFKWAE